MPELHIEVFNYFSLQMLLNLFNCLAMLNAAIDLCGKDHLQWSQERYQGFLHIEKKNLKIGQRYYFGDI